MREKWPKEAPGCQRGPTFRQQGPLGGHARDRKVERGQLSEGKKARGKEGKCKKCKVERERRKKGKEEGSNTPVGQRPGEFCCKII